MSSPTKLDASLKEQLKALEGVQAEMVKKDVETWKWNKRRITDIECRLDNGMLTDKERQPLINERHKLVTECTSLYSHINRALKGTVSTEDELGNFCFGG